MQSLEQDLLLSRLALRVIKQRMQAVKNKVSSSEDGFICTGFWENNIFKIEIKKDPT